jgi:tetraacyldisaccharide 4'-kinase
MTTKIYNFLEECLFEPNFLQKLICYLLSPFALIYYILAHLRRALKNIGAKKNLGIKIISIGNLTIGGSGKTPVCIALIEKYIKIHNLENNKNNKICIVLRGYGRASKGLVIVSKQGDIKCNIKTSGDEAMLLANNAINCNVIVSENKTKGILKAKKMGCNIVFLDDGFSLLGIKKFDILLKNTNKPTNNFVLPSGCYREPKSFYKFSDLILQENKDFFREVFFYKACDKNNIIIKDNLPKKMLLISGISRSKRLLNFMNKNIKYEFFEDHHIFNKYEIKNILKKYPNYKIITTLKDYVKLKELDLDLDFYIMDLNIKFSDNVNFSFLVNKN